MFYLQNYSEVSALIFCEHKKICLFVILKLICGLFSLIDWPSAKPIKSGIWKYHVTLNVMLFVTTTSIFIVLQINISSKPVIVSSGSITKYKLCRTEKLHFESFLKVYCQPLDSNFPPGCFSRMRWVKLKINVHS